MEFFCKKQIQKNNNLFFKQFNIFLLTFQTFILFSFIKYINNKLPTTKSKAIKLLNDNVLVVHESGIDIYNRYLNNCISHLINFTSDGNVLTNFNYIRFNENDNNEIIIIIKYPKLCILYNYNGSLIYEEKNETVIGNSDNNYRCLTTIKKDDGNIYYYMITFINKNSKKIYSLFFKYDKNQNNNIFLDSKEYILNNNIQIETEIITCQIMLDRINEEVIVCFYSCDQKKIGTLYINQNNYTKIEIKNKTIQFSHDIKGFKSITSSDKKKCLIYAILSGSCESTIYNINDDDFTGLIDKNINCVSSFGRLNLEYIKETNKFIYSCAGSQNIYIKIYNDDISTYSNMILINRDNSNVASIIYFNDLGYYLTSDKELNVNESLLVLNVTGLTNEKTSNINLPTTITTTIPTTIITTIQTTIPTTITTTIPTTIIKTTPTTIITTIPTTIITTISTTILTTIPTTIIKAIPTTIITTKPTTMITTMPTTIITTTPTTIPTTIITTKPATIITTIPTTIITTIPTTITNVTHNCNLEKCETCDEESLSHNLCITCNKENYYYRISPSINIGSYTFGNKIYIDCFNSSTKP